MENVTTVRVGDPAPGFALPSGPGEELDIGAVFVIDGDGEVVYRWVAEDPGREPDYGAVESAVAGVTG